MKPRPVLAMAASASPHRTRSCAEAGPSPTRPTLPPVRPGRGTTGRPRARSWHAVSVKQDCRHYVMQTVRSGERTERCRLGAAETVPFGCPDGCVFYEPSEDRHGRLAGPRPGRRGPAHDQALSCRGRSLRSGLGSLAQAVDADADLLEPGDGALHGFAGRRRAHRSPSPGAPRRSRGGCSARRRSGGRAERPPARARSSSGNVSRTLVLIEPGVELPLQPPGDRLPERSPSRSRVT